MPVNQTNQNTIPQNPQQPTSGQTPMPVNPVNTNSNQAVPNSNIQSAVQTQQNSTFTQNQYTQAQARFEANRQPNRAQQPMQNPQTSFTARNQPVLPNQNPINAIDNKHLGYVNQVSSQTIPQPVQQQPRTNAYQQPAPIPSTAQNNIRTPQPNSRNEYLNPSNIQQKIQQPAKPQNVAELKQVAYQANKLPQNEQMEIGYSELEKQGRIVQINTYDVLKLCIYIIPGIQIFLLLLKSIKDETVMWHARQSLIAQVIWLTVLTVFNLINFPLISGSGFSLATIWNILMIGVLIYAGSMAYAGKQFRIPIIAEIGTVFIDGRKA